LVKITALINASSYIPRARKNVPLYTSLFIIMVANEKKTEKQTEQKLN